MHSTGQTSVQALQSVQLQVSIMYSSLFLKIEFSGHINLQLSQPIHLLVISKK